MIKNKGQSNIISLIMIILMSILFISATYYWLLPTVKEITSLDDIERMEKQMLDLHNAISQASREKSQRSLEFNIKQGTIRVRENSILYEGSYEVLPESKVSEEKILYGGINDTITVGTDTLAYLNCSENAIGELGEDEAVCLLERGNIEIELRYLKLRDKFTGDIYNIRFVPSKRAFGSSGRNQISIQWVNMTVFGTSSPRNITKNLLIEIY